MADPNKYPEQPPANGPVQIGKILPDILGRMEEGPVDDEPGRKLAARLHNAEQYAQTIQEEIDAARAAGEPTSKLEAVLRQANVQIDTVREGFMPEHDTRPQ